MAAKETSDNIEFDIDEAASWLNPSWLNLGTSSEFSSWTHARDLREQNKKLRRIYEESGREDYGLDVKPPDFSAAAKAAAASELKKRVTVALELRNKHIEEVVRKMGASRRLDLCFLVDITGSMAPHIQGVKNSIHAIVDKLATAAADGQKYGTSTMMTTPLVTSGLGIPYKSRPIVQMVRLAFVGYRDINDAVPFETLQFTESVDQFYNFCGSLVATGGADGPEDVFGGLEKAIQLGWTTDGSTRMLFHIADAPCHGIQFHSFTVDHFPGGDPKGRSLESLLGQLADNEIQYHFGKINERTDKMVEAFARVYAGDLVICEMKNADQILDNVVSTASIAVTQVVTNTNGGHFRKNVTAKMDFEHALPNWAELPVQTCTLLSYEMPAFLDDLILGLPLKQKTPLKAFVKIAKKPFAAGAERCAFYGQDVTNGGAEPISIVLKKYSINGASGRYFHASIHYEMAIQMQTIAAYFAAKFSQDMISKIGRGYPIKFLKTQVLSYVDATSGGRVFMACEKSYPTGFQYLRFTNNMDYTMLEETAKLKGVDVAFIAQLFAFSHWTYQVSNGQLMVVDLQGIISTGDGDERRIELTDPAIHAADITRFGRTNLGDLGMRAFFSSHVCNDVCKQMGLVVPEKFRNTE